MENQQNGNNGPVNYNQSWSEAVLKNEKFGQLKSSKILSVIAAVFSTIWIACLIAAIILFVVSSGATYGLDVGGGVLIAIGILSLFVGFIISIIAAAKIFSAANSQIVISNNPNFHYNASSLTGPKILSVVGVILFGWIIGTVLFWIIVHQLSKEIRKYK